MIRALIVENNPNNAQTLVASLEELFKDMKIISVCDNVNDSILAIRQHDPDVVFLDIELNNKETGFQILEQIEDINFEIIFTTGYQDFLKRAIEFSALAYIDKPCSHDDLKAAIEKLKTGKTKVSRRQIDILLENIKNPLNQETPVAIQLMVENDTTGKLEALSGAYYFVKLSNIIYIGSDRESGYLMIHLKEQTAEKYPLKHRVNLTLDYYKKALAYFDFLDVHRTAVVNRRHIAEYHSGKNKYVVVSNGDVIPVRRGMDDNLFSPPGML